MGEPQPSMVLATSGQTRRRSSYCARQASAMLPKRLEETLTRLEELVRIGRFEEVETDEFEIKSVPATGGQWTKIYESINAFLNTRGGFVILGIKESGQGAQRRYELTGWRPEMEGKLKPAAIAAEFRDLDGDPLDLSDSIRALSVRPFLTAQIAILQVAELPDQDKYALLQDRAFQRLATGDHEISESQLARQREFCQQARRARELEVVPGTSLEDIDLEAFNLYLQQVNARSRVENLKTSLVDAQASLEKRRFLRDGQATVLGLLVCGVQAENRLGLRAQVHCFVDVPNEVASENLPVPG
ncbi:MAG: helix-turn-helix domain-containing protein, partial [Planctomycetaceae bacterium]